MATVELEAVIGHCTFCGFLSRMTLSIFHAAYAFLKQLFLLVAAGIGHSGLEPYVRV